MTDLMSKVRSLYQSTFEPVHVCTSPRLYHLTFVPVRRLFLPTFIPSGVCEDLDRFRLVEILSARFKLLKKNLISQKRLNIDSVCQTDKWKIFSDFEFLVPDRFGCVEVRLINSRIDNVFPVKY